MSAIPSKEIKDYFEAKLSDLRPGIELPFNVFLFFEMNSHIMLWKRRGDAPNAEFLEKYQGRGLERIWIHSQDAAAFKAYKTPQLAVAPASSDATPTLAEAAPSPDGDELPDDIAAEIAKMLAEEAQNPKPSEEPRSPEAEKLVEAMNSGDPKKAAEQAQALVAEAAAADTPEAQADANAKMRAIVRDVMDELSKEASSLVSEVWKLADIDPELEHAVNVATFAVIFAMAFGRIDKAVIADLALAGLLHDVGMTQVSAHLSSKPWKSFTPSELNSYSHHVNAGLELIVAYAPEVTERVRTLIHQHHEKFDGSGYPQRLQGFKVDDVAQLVSISDVLDSVASGKWDGTIRSLKSTLEFLEGLEKSRTFPEYFNPDVFGIVATWSRTTNAGAPKQDAMDAVKSQTSALLKSA
jgi:HD-GYP domain-containing protein (c-di-GMP phosphodiesterase class II)